MIISLYLSRIGISKYLRLCIYMCVYAYVRIVIISSKSRDQDHTTWESRNWVLIAPPQIAFSMTLAKALLFSWPQLPHHRSWLEVCEASSTSKIVWFVRLLHVSGLYRNSLQPGGMSLLSVKCSGCHFIIYQAEFPWILATRNLQFSPLVWSFVGILGTFSF